MLVYSLVLCLQWILPCLVHHVSCMVSPSGDRLQNCSHDVRNGAGLPLPAIFSCICGCTPTVCWKFTEVYQSCFAFLALMTISAGSETVFQWVISALVNLACVISFCQSAGSSVFQQRLLFSDGSLSILPFLASVSIFFPWIGLFEYWCLYPPSR